MQQDKDLKSLDDLIAGFGGVPVGTQSAGPCELLLEHLQAARRGLLGSMSGEYDLNMEQAKESLAAITDKSFRETTKASLQVLIDSAVARRDAVRAGVIPPR